MIRRVISTVFCAVISGAAFGQGVEIEKAASQMASRISASGPATIAVVDFTDLQGRVTELGRYYAEELSIALVNAGDTLKVIDRGHLQTLLKEHKLQNSGMIDEKTAAELGRIAGVTILVTGSVTELADNLRLTLKALDTRTAGIKAATSVSLAKTAATAALLRRDVGESGAMPSAAASSSASRAAAPNARVFQNDFLIVTVDSLAVKKERDRICAYLSLTFENKSTKDESIAFRLPDGGSDRVSMMDSQGNSWRVERRTGLPITYVDRYNLNPGGRFARISPGSRQTVLVSFGVGNGASELPSGALASFSMELVRLVEQAQYKAEYFSVGISGIPLGK